MINKIITLFKIARKLSQSDTMKIISKFHEPPKIIKFFFYLLSFSFSNPKKEDNNLNEEQRLCNSIQEMGTTFIKLGQFLSTRPDIIGNEIAKKLENLQDKLPPFSSDKAKKIMKKELGENNYNSLINISEPVAAASNLKSSSRFVISFRRNTTSTSFNLLVFFTVPSIIKANNIKASISSLNFFLMFGLNILIAISFIVPLSFN